MSRTTSEHEAVAEGSPPTEAIMRRLRGGHRSGSLAGSLGGRTWLVLSAAIALEVAATLALRAAIDAPWWGLLTAVGYLGAFGCLVALLRGGAAVGAIYAIWAASGVALTALLAAVIFGEALTWPMVLGIVVVMIGVALVETGHTTKAASPAPRTENER